MPYSSGSFTLVAGNPVVTATVISSTWANNTLTDIASGLSTAMLKDGTQTMTANIPMGGKKFTGLANGTAAADSAAWGQIAGGIVPTGLIGDGVTDDSASINTALATGKMVFMPKGTYAIGATIFRQAEGQWLYGSGGVDDNLTGGTQLKALAALAGGKMISDYDSIAVLNRQDGGWRGLTLNANTQAKIAVEGYNTTPVPVGAWRNQYVDIYVYGLTGAGNTAFDLGAGTGGDNANDVELNHCYVEGAAIGITSGGATTRATGSTFKKCTNAAVGLVGSAWYFDKCVFTQSGFGSAGYDFQATGLCQQVSYNNCWFENSLTGLFGPSTAGGFRGASTLTYTGCYLHTDGTNTTLLIDTNTQAMHLAVLGCICPPASGSGLIKNIHASTVYDIASSNVTIDTGYAIYTTLPIRGTQCEFGATLTSDATNATGDGTTVNLSSSAFTEAYDPLNYFNASTGVYTAGVPGHYQFNVQVSLGNIGAAHTDAAIKLVTTTQTYLLAHCNAATMCELTGNTLILQGSITAGMVATDTAYIRVIVAGSTKTITIRGSNSAYETRFDGFMVG